MKFRIAALAIILVSLIACSETAENKPEIVNSSPPASNSTNTAVGISPPTNAANTFSANGSHATTLPPSTANAKPLTFAAPDNSQFSVEMGGSGLPVETRTFTGDKYVAKVVRSWQEPSKKTISIYLKSGKVVSVAGDKWPDIRSQPVSVFYEAAGIKLAEKPSAEPKRKTEQQQ